MSKKFGKEEARCQEDDNALKSPVDEDVGFDFKVEDDVFHPSVRRKHKVSGENMLSTRDYNMVMQALMRSRCTRRKGELLREEMIEPF